MQVPDLGARNDRAAIVEFFNSLHRKCRQRQQRVAGNILSIHAATTPLQVAKESGNYVLRR
jgi:hypothetical protein